MCYVENVDNSPGWMERPVCEKLEEKRRGKKLGLPQHNLVFMRGACGFLLAMTNTMVAAHGTKDYASVF
jgi:hypothetical protein